MLLTDIFPTWLIINTAWKNLLTVFSLGVRLAVFALTHRPDCGWSSRTGPAQLWGTWSTPWRCWWRPRRKDPLRYNRDIHTYMRTFDLNVRLLERLSSTSCCFQQPLHALVMCLNVFSFDFILILLGVFVSCVNAFVGPGQRRIPLTIWGRQWSISALIWSD